MEGVIRFSISLFDIAAFMYYFSSFKKMKKGSRLPATIAYFVSGALWASVTGVNSPMLNLGTLLFVLIVMSLFFQSGTWTRVVTIALFIGVGMLFEPVGVIMLHAMDYDAAAGE